MLRTRHNNYYIVYNQLTRWPLKSVIILNRKIIKIMLMLQLVELIAFLILSKHHGEAHVLDSVFINHCSITNKLLFKLTTKNQQIAHILTYYIMQL